jgi:hypothetical protein
MDIKVLFAWALLLTTAACTVPKYDGGNLQGKAAILDATHVALSSEDCTTAIAAIESLYGSSNTDNEVRMARASAQGCAAGVSNFFSTFGQLVSNADSLGGSGLWETMSKMFWETDADALDKRITAGGYSTDALMAATKAGSVIAATSQVGGAPNVGSLLGADREDTANLYLVFISMSQIGALQNRFGSPNASTYKRGQIMGKTATNADGWTKATKVDSNACAYAAAILNMIDSIAAVSNALSGSSKDNFAKITDAFSVAIGAACNEGCKGVAYATGCGFTDDDCQGTATRPCPLSLHNRNSCTGSTSDRASCAAAGIAKFISSDVLGWQQ